LFSVRTHSSASETDLPFQLALPESGVINKSTPAEDFDIYTVTVDKKDVIKIYVGNAPSLKDITRGANTAFMANNVAIYSSFQDDQLRRRDIVIKLREKDWPMFIHAWTIEGTPQEVSVADQILMGLRVPGNVDATEK